MLLRTIAALMLALALLPGGTVITTAGADTADTAAPVEPECMTGDDVITPSKLKESFIKWGEMAAQYGISFRQFDGKDAAAFIRLADEIKPDPKYPGDPDKITTVIVFAVNEENMEKLPRARIFVFRGDDCELFRLDWNSHFVHDLINEFDKRNV
jgi:hypothetical protein